jgi:hypothetical protein
MSKSLLSRLGKLEAASSDKKGARPWHRIIAWSHEEAEAKHSALIASGQLSKDDNAVYRIITGDPRSQGGIAR